MKLSQFSPMDVAASRGKGRNRIQRIGIELEGGWDTLPTGVTALEHDGSVKFRSAAVAKELQVILHNRWRDYTRAHPEGMTITQQQDRLTQMQADIVRELGLPTEPQFIGELPSKQLVLSAHDIAPEGEKNLLWTDWIRAHYPHHVNESCGMHVHMSFKSALSYQRLMDGRYPRTIVEEFKKWATHEKLPDEHPMWSRLLGESRYCQHVFYADSQAIQTQKGHRQDIPGHRYTVVSYQYARLGTLECRLLPMFQDIEQAIRAIQELLDITNAIFVALATKEAPLRVDVPIEQAALREAFVERV